MAPAHRWGQNFLMSRQVLEDIADLVQSSAVGDTVLEIGPGVGGLSRTLLERGLTVWAIELDRRVAPILDELEEMFASHFHVVYGDALEMDWSELARQADYDTLSLVGNLPYYITAPLLGRLMNGELAWQSAIFMVQREVGMRLALAPGHRNSSSLAVLLRYWMDVRMGVDKVASDHFYPRPEVDSCVLQLIRHAPLPVEWESFRWIVKAGFSHRRKTLRQALAQAGGSPYSKDDWHHLISEMGLDSSIRAEQLTMENWLRLASALSERKAKAR